MDFRAQGITESVAIIGVVLVVGLASAGIVGNVGGDLSSTSQETSKSTWSNATPFAITDWGADSSGNLRLALKNNSFEKISFNSMNLTTASGADYNMTSKVNMAPGSTYIVTIKPRQLATGCATKKNYYFPRAGIVINYSTKNINQRQELAPIDLVGTCG